MRLGGPAHKRMMVGKAQKGKSKVLKVQIKQSKGHSKDLFYNLNLEVGQEIGKRRFNSREGVRENIISFAIYSSLGKFNS